MNQSLRIAIAEDDERLLKDLSETVAGLGHDVVATATNGKELVEKSRDVTPDLVITDIKMPDMDGLEAATRLRGLRPVPIVVISAYHDIGLIERAEREHVMAYLIKPIDAADLETSISLAIRRFREFEALAREANDLKRALEDRKLIERAKGVLMRRAELNEEEAFRRLQDLASTKHQKMVEIAKTILVAEEAFSASK